MLLIALLKFAEIFKKSIAKGTSSFFRIFRRKLEVYLFKSITRKRVKNNLSFRFTCIWIIFHIIRHWCIFHLVIFRWLKQKNNFCQYNKVMATPAWFSSTIYGNEAKKSSSICVGTRQLKTKIQEARNHTQFINL